MSIQQYLPAKPNFNCRLSLQIPWMIENCQMNELEKITKTSEWQEGGTPQQLLFFQKLSQSYWKKTKKENYIRLMLLFLKLYLSWYHTHVAVKIRFDCRLAQIKKFSLPPAGTYIISFFQIEVNNPQINCPYCIRGYLPTEKAVLLPGCGHIFHHSCITFYTYLFHHCPICKLPVKRRKIK